MRSITGMERARKVVKVTRRGQTTIPIEFRKRHRIEQGSRLVVEDRGDSIVLRPVARLEDLGGFLSKTTTSERLLKILDQSREDED
jgi:AbrB family looped-hinge helix DNA binding protein